MQLVEPAADACEVGLVEGEVDVLLEQERREVGVARERHVVKVERIDVELGPQEALVEVDDAVQRLGRMRNHVHAVRQHEAQVARSEGAHLAADGLPRMPFDADLDLEVGMPVRQREFVARALEADVEVEVVGTLVHAVGAYGRGMRGAHRGWRGGGLLAARVRQLPARSAGRLQAQTTTTSSAPTPATVPRMRSPRCTAATPAGVPVKIRSPGCSVNRVDR